MGLGVQSDPCGIRDDHPVGHVCMEVMTMRLIDVDALLKQIDEDSEGSPGWYGDTWQFIETIENAPTIKTKLIKYFDEDENVWKVGEVIVDE